MIGITGGQGFLARHLRNRLHCAVRRPFLLADRETFASAAALDQFTASCDRIVHLAGVNRADPAEVEAGNEGLARQLAASIQRTGATRHVVFANSVHLSRDTAYGRGKKKAAEVLAAWAETTGGCFTDLVVPNVFGEGGRPYYNSFVATFCDQITQDRTLSVNSDDPVELIHAQDVAAALIAALDEPPAPGGTVRRQLEGRQTTVPEVARLLTDMHGRYAEDRSLPDLRDPFVARLFNTYRFALFGRRPVAEVRRHVDPRGWLVEQVRTLHPGQGYISGTKPGITRGNHLHLRKFERFLVVAGEADISLRRLFETEITSFKVAGDKPVYVDIPTFHTHSITNIGQTELITVFWSSEWLDPDDTDTYPEPVVRPE